MITKKSRAGRKPAHPLLKKKPINLKLEQYLINWLDAQPESRAKLIAQALIEKHNIIKPEQNNDN